MGRDLTGFEDGTANPKTLDKKLEAAVITSQNTTSHTKSETSSPSSGLLQASVVCEMIQDNNMYIITSDEFYGS